MTSTRSSLSVRGFLTATGLAFVAVLAFAAPASAHNYYVSSTPGIDQVLTSLPDEFVVTTNDNLLELGGSEGGFFMEVKGPDDLYYGDGCVTVAGPSVSMAAAVGPAGEYSLAWQVISADGHTVSGEIPFSWQPAAGNESTTEGASTPQKCGTAPEPQATENPQGQSTQPPSADDTTGTGAPANSQGAGSDSTSEVLWIGGAILAIAIAVVATLMLVRPKPKD